MRSCDQTDPLEKRTRTRRNVIAIGSILGGALLAGCKQEVDLIPGPQNVGNSKRPHGARNLNPNCFLRGTRISTPLGERRIEHLRIGDQISTVSGEGRSIRWIGRRRYLRTSGMAWREELKPIRIRRGAFQPRVPHADLLVSQDHRLYIDGVLIRAADLVNGTTIVSDVCIGGKNPVAHLEYLHLLLDGHHAIWAEGAATESMLYNESNIQLFDNFPDFEARYGSAPLKPEQSFAPGYSLPGRRSRLTSHFRSAVSPWIDRRTPIDRVRDRWIDH